MPHTLSFLYIISSLDAFVHFTVFRMEIQYVYQKKRSEFGRHAQFSDRAAEIHVDIPPDMELRKDFMPRNPCNIGIQAVQQMSEHTGRDCRVFVDSTVIFIFCLKVMFSMFCKETWKKPK